MRHDVLTILTFVHKTKCNIIGDGMLCVENNISQCSADVNIYNIHLYSIFSTHYVTLLCPNKQSNNYGTTNGYAGCAGLTFFCNDHDSVSDCQIGNMSVVNIWIGIVADIDSSTISRPNSCNNVIISTIVVYLYNVGSRINAEAVLHFNTILLTAYENCFLDCNVRNGYYLGCFWFVDMYGC